MIIEFFRTISNANHLRFEKIQTNFQQLPDEVFLTILQFISGENNEHRDDSICYDLNPISLVNKKLELLTRSPFLKRCRLESEMILSIKNVMKVIPIMNKITYDIISPSLSLPGDGSPILLLKIEKNEKQKNVVEIARFEHVYPETEYKYKDYVSYYSQLKCCQESKVSKKNCFDNNTIMVRSTRSSKTHNLLKNPFFKNVYMKKIDCLFSGFRCYFVKNKESESSLNGLELNGNREANQCLRKIVGLIEMKLKSLDFSVFS